MIILGITSHHEPSCARLYVTNINNFHEAARLTELPVQSRLRFVARLSFELTIAGRSSYEAGTDELARPRQLRLVNEIQHRVISCLSQLVNGNCPDHVLTSMADWVLASQDT